jgi:glycosyltransferase involved in cell wall biosynthesis
MRERAAAGLDGRFAVLTVGGVEPRKGSLTLLEGFARLRRLARDLDPLLIVAGGATLFDYREELGRFAARARELGIARNVRQLGTVTPAELERLYRAADVFAFPSEKEGFGLAALEALSAGLPVVASDLAVFRTFLDDGASALLCPVGDGEALGDALARLARDEALRERLRAGGRAVVAAHGWEEAAAAHEHVYRRFLARRTPEAA